MLSLGLGKKINNMSKWYTQVTYKCECEEGYGSQCGKQSRFVLKHNCSIDATTIYHKRHIEDADSKYALYEMGEYISDPEIGALHKLLGEQPYNDKYVREGEEIDKDFFAQT